MTNTWKVDSRCLEMARRQFCLDMGMDWEEYLERKEQPVIICKNRSMDGARKYAGRSSFFWAVICLGQLLITCDESIYDWVNDFCKDSKPEWFCAFDTLRKLNEKLQSHGYQIADTHVYFLPEGAQPLDQPLDPSFLWYEKEEILRFKECNRFTSAICFWDGQPDMLALAKMKDGIRISEKPLTQEDMEGMAGASGDGRYLWQIGINVDPSATGKGLANRLVRSMKEEIMRRGMVPFYGTSESHIVSQTVGLKAGFVPAWTEVFCEKMGGY